MRQQMNRKSFLLLIKGICGGNGETTARCEAGEQAHKHTNKLFYHAHTAQTTELVRALAFTIICTFSRTHSQTFACTHTRLYFTRTRTLTRAFTHTHIFSLMYCLIVETCGLVTTCLLLECSRLFG
jgi:hypothetical protein